MRGARTKQDYTRTRVYFINIFNYTTRKTISSQAVTIHVYTSCTYELILRCKEGDVIVVIVTLFSLEKNTLDESQPQALLGEGMGGRGGRGGEGEEEGEGGENQ